MIEGGKSKAFLYKHQKTVKEIKKRKVLKEAVKNKRLSNLELEDQLYLTNDRVHKK